MLKLITAPTVNPVSLLEAKAHLRVDHTDDDAQIAAMITAATRHAENFTGRALVDQTWELYLDAFPCNEVQIKKPPMIEIVSVKYDDGAGNEQTIDPASYTVDAISEPGWVLPASSGAWPSTFDSINAVRIRFRAGYPVSADSPPDPAANVPQDIKNAILMEVGTFYSQRETVVIGQTVVQLPNAWEWLLRPHRVETGMA